MPSETQLLLCTAFARRKLDVWIPQIYQGATGLLKSLPHGRTTWTVDICLASVYLGLGIDGITTKRERPRGVSSCPPSLMVICPGRLVVNQGIDNRAKCLATTRLSGISQVGWNEGWAPRLILPRLPCVGTMIVIFPTRSGYRLRKPLRLHLPRLATTGRRARRFIRRSGSQSSARGHCIICVFGKGKKYATCSSGHCFTRKVLCFQHTASSSAHAARQYYGGKYRKMLQWHGVDKEGGSNLFSAGAHASGSGFGPCWWHFTLFGYGACLFAASLLHFCRRGLGFLLPYLEEL